MAWAYYHAGYQDHLLAKLVKILISFVEINSTELSNNVFKDHIDKIVPHKLCIRD